MLDSQKWNKKEHTPGPRADLTPDSRRSRERHFKNAAVWLSPSRKLILGLPCFWSEIFTFFRLFCLDLCIFLIIFNFFWKIHHFVCIFLYKMHIWYMVLIFYKIFIFSFKIWLLYLKLHVFGRFFSKKPTLSQKSLNLMKLLKTLTKVLKNDFFFHFWIFLIIIISEYTHPNIFRTLFLESASNSTLILKKLDVTYV